MVPLSLSFSSFWITLFYHHVQSFTKYLRRTLVFIWNSKLREKFNFCFSRDVLLALTKFSFFQEELELGYHSMKFRHFSDISLKSFSNLVKHQNVSKYYENDCVIFFFFLMFLLTALIVKNSHIHGRILSIFLKNVLKQTWESFSNKFQPQ